MELHGSRGLNVVRFGGLSEMGLLTQHVNLMAVLRGITIPLLSPTVEISCNITPITIGRVPMDCIR